MLRRQSVVGRLYTSIVLWVETIRIPRADECGRRVELIYSLYITHTCKLQSRPAPPPFLVRYMNRPAGHQTRYTKRLIIRQSPVPTIRCRRRLIVLVIFLSFLSAPSLGRQLRALSGVVYPLRRRRRTGNISHTSPSAEELYCILALATKCQYGRTNIS